VLTLCSARDGSREQHTGLLLALQVQLRCRQELLQGGMTLGLVQQQLWRPHATSGQLLHIDVEWHAAADAPS
jgi:hypothetical protein